VEPRVRQLERLTLPIWTEQATVTVASAANLAGLDSLQLDLAPEFDEAPAQGRLAALARSPHLVGLRELAVGPNILDPDSLRVLVRGAAWKGLRRLALPACYLRAEQWAGLFTDATLPELEELHLPPILLNRYVIDGFVRSSLLKQLRHLSLWVVNVRALSDAYVRRLADIVDPERIETFALFPDHKTPALEELRKRFGDRLRMP
jgi:hypothetical protein